MPNDTTAWRDSDLCLAATSTEANTAADEIHRRVCRTNLTQPGFCLVRLEEPITSFQFRRFMLSVAERLSERTQALRGEPLAVVSAGRFDQQESTRLHLDGGPPESLLLLGYEPSAVQSVLEIADYSACCSEEGLTPSDFLARFNPMFQAGIDRLQPFTQKLPCFRSETWQLLCINNSSVPSQAHPDAWQGVLHTASIPQPEPSQRRIINSMMLAPQSLCEGKTRTKPELEEFATTSVVRRRGYDQPDIADDA